MSLDGAKLAKELKNALKDLDPDKKASDISSKYQSTIKDYLMKNIDIKLSYAGVIPGPSPDPEPVFKGKLSYVSFTFLPAATKELFDLQLSQAIKGGMIINGDTANGIVFPPLAFNPGAFIITQFPKFDPSNDSVGDFMESYCSSIVNQIKTKFVSITPSAGARATAGSTGPVTMLSIA